MRKKINRDSVSSGERKQIKNIILNILENITQEGESPVKMISFQIFLKTGLLSKTGHVLSCLNIAGPPAKSKYVSMTDSGQVL